MKVWIQLMRVLVWMAACFDEGEELRDLLLYGENLCFLANVSLWRSEGPWFRVRFSRRVPSSCERVLQLGHTFNLKQRSPLPQYTNLTACTMLSPVSPTDRHTIPETGVAEEVRVLLRSQYERSPIIERHSNSTCNLDCSGI